MSSTNNVARYGIPTLNNWFEYDHWASCVKTAAAEICGKDREMFRALRDFKEELPELAEPQQDFPGYTGKALETVQETAAKIRYDCMISRDTRVVQLTGLIDNTIGVNAKSFCATRGGWKDAANTYKFLFLWRRVRDCLQGPTSSSNPIEQAAVVRKLFETCVQHPEEGLPKYILNFETAWSCLPEEQRSAYTQPQLADKFIRGLKTPYFQAFKANYLQRLTERTKPPYKTLQKAQDAASNVDQQVKAELKASRGGRGSQKRKEHDVPESALVTQSKKKRKPNRKTNDKTNDSGPRFGDYGGNFRGKCNNCNQTGHIASFCKKSS